MTATELEEPSEGAAPGPFAAYTDEAELYEVPDGDLEQFLPPFAAGLLMAAGRMLAAVAYRDAAHYGDRPFDRTAKDANASVLAQLPAACDEYDQVFRLQVARALGDLADDLAAGRAPLARCQAETWALSVMLESAPRMCAATDEELTALGITVPDDADENTFRAPYWDEEAWAFVVEEAKYSIPEARGDDSEEEVPEPEDGWDAPAYWFSPYGITRPRDPGRGHPAWVRDHLGGAPLTPPAPLTIERAEQLLRLGDDTNSPQPHLASYADSGSLAEVLTPLGARLLAVAADHLAERGRADLFHHGDRVFERPTNDDDVWELEQDSFLIHLPPLCDGQSAAWRLAMVRAVEHLAGDLRSGRAPLPTCTAEELAFHLIVAEAEQILDLLTDDEEFAYDCHLPTADAFTVRHRTFGRWKEFFLQDFDVLMHYDDTLREIATDPDHPTSQQLGTGDLRPRAWFEPFGNMRPRSATPVPADILEMLATADPDTFFASTPALKDDTPHPPATPVLPEGLRAEFEHFTALAQHRFFDEPTAIAMAVSLERLLTLLLSTPALVPAQLWPLNPRASAVNAGRLLVDDDFCLAGLDHTWRLNADRTDAQARTFTTQLLTDCANYALAHYGRTPGDLLRGGPPATPLDPNLPDMLCARLTDLARDVTAAGLLGHRITHLGLTTRDLAEHALLPEPLVTAWFNGTPVSPSQIIRCAPVLQTSEDVLLAAVDGRRDPEYWPLPVPPKDHLDHHERDPHGTVPGTAGGDD